MNGLYIHVPFCVAKCGYCDFYSVTDLKLKGSYLKAVSKEISIRSKDEKPENRKVDTVYFGGGTPSLLFDEGLDIISEVIRNCYDLMPHAEITAEVNPGTVSKENMRKAASAGINRLSIGVQSFNNRALSFLGRIHTAEEAEKAIVTAENAGFSNISIDIIYGLPGQTKYDLLKDLEKALSFEPAHMSCYMLSYENDTPLGKKLKKGTVKPLPEGSAAELYEITRDFLEEKGFIHYETSNFSESLKRRSNHNVKYWNFSPYRGFGPAAHSFYPDLKKRSWNVRDLPLYIETLEKGLLPVDDMEILTKEQMITEAVYLGLRQNTGINTDDFKRHFEMDFYDAFKNPVNRFLKEKLAVIKDQNFILSAEGQLFADHITECMVKDIKF